MTKPDTKHSYSKKNYYGRILHGNYSEKLKKTVNEQIKAYNNFDKIGLPIITYMAAWDVDRPGIWYEFVNKRFLELFGCDPSDIGEMFCNSILDRREYEHSNIFPIKEMILQGKELDNQRPRLREESVKTGTMQAVYKIGLPDNRVLWLKDWATVTTFIKEGICLSPGYLTDISMEMEQKDQVSKLNILVNREKKLLVEAERSAALGQLSAKVYHEIRNPISAIGGLARRLLKKLHAYETQPFLEVIVKESSRLEEILSNLFNFTKQVELDPVESDPVNLVKRVVGLLRSEMEHEGINVSIEAQEGLPPILIDKEQMHLALIHIIKNSIEAMSEGGLLAINLHREKENISISIRDTGTGIQSAYEKRITEPFFTTKVYGTGLGLSIAQKAIQLHNGSLTIKQLGSGGTEIIILLPLEAPSSSAKASVGP